MRRSTYRHKIQPKNQSIVAATQVRTKAYAEAQGLDWLASVLADGEDCRWYSVRKDDGVACTCQTTSVENPSSKSATQLEAAQATVGQDNINSFRITTSDVFNIVPEDGKVDELDDESLALEGPSAGTEGWFIENPLQDGVDCPVCYRLSMQPGYELAQGNRLLLTTLSPCTMVGASVLVRGKAPAMFEVYDIANAGVTFSITVPKYVRAARAVVYLDKQPLEVVSIPSIPGSFNFRVTQSFTHAVVEWDMNMPALRVSIPNLTAISDAMKFTKVAAPNLIVGNQVSARTRDLIYLPRFDLRLLVTEVRPLAYQGQLIGQECSVRVVQPMETVYLLPLAF